MPITDREVMVALKAAGNSMTDVQAFMRRMYADRQHRVTQRDAFATAALSGRIASSDRDRDAGLTATYAYQCADAMLIARGGRASEVTPDLTASLQALLLLVDPNETYPASDEVIAARAALAKAGVQ